MRAVFCLLVAFQLLIAAPSSAAPPSAAPWPESLYLDGGGWWTQRIPVGIVNDGTTALAGWPIVVTIGEEQGQAALVGAQAQSVRVCDDGGAELLFVLRSPDGKDLREGPVPAGATLVLPAECAPQARERCYVYFGNPAAGLVPDFLQARIGIQNPDVEAGEGDTPLGWSHDRADDQHVASWSSEQPQSGQRCLKTTVAPGAEATWIATRQGDITVTGSAKYRFSAWVRGQDVIGMAGWYLHVGNRQEPMLLAPTLSGGEGSFAWKQVTAEFTVPAAADRLSLGTVLRGTGTAWFDNARLEQLGEGHVRVEVDAVETLVLDEQQAPGEWLEAAGDGTPPARRAAVRVLSPGSDPASRGLVAVDLQSLRARNRGRLDPRSLSAVGPSGLLRHAVLGDRLLLETPIQPRSVQTIYLYFSPPPAARDSASTSETAEAQRVRDAAADVARGHLDPWASAINLVRNPGGELGQPQPEVWVRSGDTANDGVLLATDRPDREGFGQRCLKLHVPKAARKGWRGWRQDVPVRPGRTYLLAAWVKCQDAEGSVRVHAHRRQANGEMSAHAPYASIGPSITGTTDWTLMCDQLTMPEDTNILQVHLTMEDTGTLWYDNVLVAEVLGSRVVGQESRSGQTGGELALWQVPAVVKVFRDDSPESSGQALRIEAARNESEPLQLAVRSTRARASLRLEVDVPAGPNGFRLPPPEINVVGYVPVDYPTNYYRSDVPAWRRRIPTASPACDGWAGLWPDPLLPTAEFSLEAGAAQSVWVTFRIPPDAPAGDYRGSVRLIEGTTPIAQQPLEVHVFDFQLPDENHVAAIYDVRFGPGGAQQWGSSLDELYPDIIRFMASRRLCPDTIRPAPRFWVEDGQVRADFTQYDQAAELYFEQLGFPFAYTPWNLYLFGWGHPPKTIFGQAPFDASVPLESVDRSRLEPEYRRLYQQMLKLFWDHLRERGWDRKIVLYISDEPFDSQEHIRVQMKTLCEMIHQVDPEIPIYCSTWHHVPAWDGSLNIWGIGHDGRVPAAKLAQLREAGDRIWFTTDGQMCTDTPYCAVERLLPHYCYRYGAEAYEFWGVSWLTYDPFRFGWHAFIHQSSQPGEATWVRYPNGDGFLIYPGKLWGHQGLLSSIRLEQAREGVEDYEYLYLLGQLVRTADVGADRAAGERALAAAAMLVEMPNAGGRYSTKILPDPEAVYRVRHAVADAIERLLPR